MVVFFAVQSFIKQRNPVCFVNMVSTYATREFNFVHHIEINNGYQLHFDRFSFQDWCYTLLFRMFEFEWFFF